MQRELKFRVWDHNLKKFIEDSNADPHICWNGKVYCHERQKEGGDVLVSGIRNITVQQYTGMKDKNGKEIYEGDIVQDKYDECIMLIQWEEFYARFGGIIYLDHGQEPDFDAYCWMDELDECEIIGNIFENLDLLKV